MVNQTAEIKQGAKPMPPTPEELEDQHWANLAREAEKSGWVGPEAAMEALKKSEEEKRLTQ